MRKDRIFFTINEINEALSSSNHPRQIINLALSVLSKILNVDASWVHLTNVGSQEEVLTTSRGLTSAQSQELLEPALRHVLNDRIGTGDLVIVPDISRDEYLSRSTFVKAGFGSLIVVPLMTYQIRGILGTMWRVTKGFDTDYGFLLMVIGSLICSALERAALYERLIGDAEPEPEVKYDIEEFEKLVALAEKYSRATRLAIEEAVVRAKGTESAAAARPLADLGERVDRLLSGNGQGAGDGTLEPSEEGPSAGLTQEQEAGSGPPEESIPPPEAGPKEVPAARDPLLELHERRMRAFKQNHPANVKAWPSH
jgi:hypothetical protein